MSRLQEAVEAFLDEWRKTHSGQPGQDVLLDGPFSYSRPESFCLCLRLATGVASMINLAGLYCNRCDKPVTEETYEWFDEARRERASAPAPGA